MKEAQTISEVLQKLHAEGYTQSFKAEKTGLRDCEKNILVMPQDLEVDDIFRFEGETDLDEEAMIFALTCVKNKMKGTYLVAFGTKMDPLDEQMVRRLDWNNKV